MNAMLPSITTLAISAIYCIWHGYREFCLRRESILRQRVAYMLWVVATRTD